MRIIRESASSPLTHQEFDAAYARAKAGESVIDVVAGRVYRFDAKAIARLEKDGRPALKKAKNGHEFLMRSGSRYLYVTPGQIFEVR
jgi:hypothetical protein